MDKLLRKNLIVGAALGFGWDSIKLDEKGSRTTATNPSASIYASFKASDKMFIDGLVGYGSALLKNARWQSNDEVMVHGRRRASTYFGSLMATLALATDTLKFEPFVLGDFMSSRLNSYAETGDTALALTYNSIKSRASSISGGANMHRDIVYEDKTFIPSLKVQYSRTHSSSTTQRMYYSDTPNSMYYYTIQGLPKETIGGQLGLSFKKNNGTSCELTFGYTMGSNAYVSRTFGAAVKVPF